MRLGEAIVGATRAEAITVPAPPMATEAGIVINNFTNNELRAGIADGTDRGCQSAVKAKLEYLLPPKNSSITCPPFPSDAGAADVAAQLAPTHDVVVKTVFCAAGKVA